MPTETERTMTPEEYAKLSKLGRSTVYRMLNDGEIKAVRLRRRWIINRRAAYDQLGIGGEIHEE